eukprot:TRINITY_DN16784_c0_g2_i2.p1 TRINITY_DN16784_c0_g2~~TRINITY_DN16784_c0_g2_i2.p1  ORF type:complete len:499 (+),score=39.34 TRINITY_DN16784_c0_g2_i2:151-1647(+)
MTEPRATSWLTQLSTLVVAVCPAMHARSPSKRASYAQHLGLHRGRLKSAEFSKFLERLLHCCLPCLGSASIPEDEGRESTMSVPLCKKVVSGDDAKRNERRDDYLKYLNYEPTSSRVNVQSAAAHVFTDSMPIGESKVTNSYRCPPVGADEPTSFCTNVHSVAADGFTDVADGSLRPRTDIHVQTSTYFCMHVCNVAGDGFQVEATGAMRGWELMNRIGEQGPADTDGIYTAIVRDSILSLTQTLEEQGIRDGDDITLLFEPATFQEEVSLRVYHELNSRFPSGRAHPLRGQELLIVSHLRHLNFESNHFCGDSGEVWSFIELVNQFPLPSGLQSITFGKRFNESVKNVTWPAGLQSLTFGHDFNQKMNGVALPSGLQSLTFGFAFDQSMERVSLPSGLQSLTFGLSFNRMMDRVELPSGLQSLTFGDGFLQSMEYVALPPGLQHLTFGQYFDRQTMRPARLCRAPGPRCGSPIFRRAKDTDGGLSTFSPNSVALLRR